MASRRKRTQRVRRAPIPEFDEPQPRSVGAFFMRHEMTDKHHTEAEREQR